MINAYKQNLINEVKELRTIGHKFLKKEVTASEFKAVSGGMGVYAQRGGEKFMIRLRIPSGIFDFSYVKLVEKYVKKYNLEFIHLTTRQAIQLHNLGIDEVCDIMEDAIIHGLYTRGAGGNFPRNVALSPLAGVDPLEVFDVTPYAKATNEYLMKHITSYKLPRKLKIAFSGSSHDTANATLTDLGFVARKKGNNKFFQVYIGGGLGNNPRVGVPFDELIKPSEVLYYVEAIIRLFMEEGDYENKGRARLRYVVERLGEKEFIECYKKHVKEVKETCKLKAIRGSSILSHGEVKKKDTTNLNNKEFDLNTIIAQKQDNVYTVEIHPECGIFPQKELFMLIDFLKKQEVKDVRLSTRESLYIRNLGLDGVKEVLKICENINKKDPISKSVSCIGVPICQIGIQNSRELLHSILQELKDKNIPSKYLPSLSISGCMNSCARHQVSVLGFAGGKKRVDGVTEDVFELHVGGKIGEEGTNFGRVVGFLRKGDIPTFLCKLASRLNELEKECSLYLEENFTDFEKLVKPYLLV